MKPTYCQKPDAKLHWRLPDRLLGRQFIAAIWRWM